jgi:hypothetical protein
MELLAILTTIPAGMAYALLLGRIVGMAQTTGRVHRDPNGHVFSARSPIQASYPRRRHWGQ